MSSLTIISHTEHYINKEGLVFGFGPTVTEINQLLEVFDEIQHVAMLHDKAPPLSALPYDSKRIKFIPLPSLGGPLIKDKIQVGLNIFNVLIIIKKAINNSDYFQFRAPTGIGVYSIPFLIFFSSKKGWFKYAGNWKQENAPISYSFQRWLLKKQKRKVTINGKWPSQPKHCLTFENPCLTQEELNEGLSIRNKRQLNQKGISFCFVGRLEPAKGIDILIDAFKNLTDKELAQVNKVHVVGSSPLKDFYQNKAKASGVSFIFHDYLSRVEVHNIYKQSEAIVLPSASEGFPKVISEAMNYGCIPIVTDISAISNYVKDGINGFLFYPVNKENLIMSIRRFLNLSDTEFFDMVNSNEVDKFKFTYAHYNKRILEEICQS